MDELADMAAYGQRVVKHFEKPRHAGIPEGANRVGFAASKPRSSRVRLHLKVDGGVVRAAGFEVLGCPHTLAAADLVCADLVGRDEEELVNYEARFLDEALPLPADKLDIRLLLEDAVRNAAN